MLIVQALQYITDISTLLGVICDDKEELATYRKALTTVSDYALSYENHHKRPVKVRCYTTHCNGKDFIYKVSCPFCDRSLCGECFDNKAPYCLWCGQALDWSEVEG